MSLESPMTVDYDSNSVVALAPGAGKGKARVVMASFLLSGFFATLEASSIPTALPIIFAQLPSNQFIWLAVSYHISSLVLLLFGSRLIEIFGRRASGLGFVALVVIGSVIATLAQNMQMLAAARVIHGVGAGGIISVSQTALLDLVPLHKAGLYNRLFRLSSLLGGCLGPIYGGLLAHASTWRVIYGTNTVVHLPVAIILALYLRSPKSSEQRNALAKFAIFDILGNGLVIVSTFAVTISLSLGGFTYSWVSPQVLAPLCVGAAGFLITLKCTWHICDDPVMPLKLLSNRSSFSGYVQIILGSTIFSVLTFYLPVYYQVCLRASPVRSGVDLLALTIAMFAGAVLIDTSVVMTGRYRPPIWLGWSIALVGLVFFGLTMTEFTSRFTSISYQVTAGLGLGMILSSSYLPVLAAVPNMKSSSPSAALSFFYLVRIFGQVFGVAVGGALLQTDLLRTLPQDTRALWAGSNIVYGLVPSVHSMTDAQRAEVQRAFSRSLMAIWKMVAGVGGVGLLASLLMQSVAPEGDIRENPEILQREYEMDALSSDVSGNSRTSRDAR